MIDLRAEILHHCPGLTLVRRLQNHHPRQRPHDRHVFQPIWLLPSSPMPMPACVPTSRTGALE